MPLVFKSIPKLFGDANTRFEWVFHCDWDFHSTLENSESPTGNTNESIPS